MTFRHLRDGKALGSVRHEEFGEGFDFQAELSAQDAFWGAGALQYRLWMFDLEAGAGEPVRGLPDEDLPPSYSHLRSDPAAPAVRSFAGVRSRPSLDWCSFAGPGKRRVQQLFEHLTAAYNAPFAVALVCFFLLVALQVVGFLLGSEWFSFMDDWLPDVDAAGGDPGGGPGLLEGALSVLYVGRVPFAITLLLWLFAFSALGYNLQLSLIALGFAPMAASLAGVLSFVSSLPIVALGNRVLARVLPGDETRAVSVDDLVGLSGEITLGTVTSTRSSEAKVRDRHQNTHYVQVVAEEAGERFAAGDEVLIVGRSGHLYTVVRDPLSE